MSEGATTVHLSVAGTGIVTFVKAGLGSSGTGLLVHDPAANPAEQHHLADGTATSDTIDIAPQGNYPGLLTAGRYASETVDLVNFSEGQGGGLTRNDILANLTNDSHGNAAVNLGHGDSIVFKHITGLIQSQINQGQPVLTLGVNQA